MMDLATIQAISRQAAVKARRAKKQPIQFWLQDIDAMKEGEAPSRAIPFLGDYKPKGWESVRLTEEFDANRHGIYSGDAGGFGAYFVDSSGFGRAGESALTVEEFATRIKPNYGYAIVESGQFQVRVGVFQKIAH